MADFRILQRPRDALAAGARGAVRRRIGGVPIAFGAAAAAVCLLAPLVGPTPIRLGLALDPSVRFADNVDAQIFFLARLPRVLAGALVGAALAAAGVVLQALLRNPLASPFTLGVSAGAALGATLVIVLGVPLAAGGVTAAPLAAFTGSVGAVGIVYALARYRRRGLSTGVLLLAGVTLNSVFSAVIMFLQQLADQARSFQAVRWLMGNLDVTSYAPIASAAPLLLAAFVVFARLPRALNLLALGPDSAASRGVDVLRAQRLAFFSASLATGAAVALGGPIGFVGIIVPHFVRLLAGADHRIVLPASACLGAAFLVACDTAARTVTAPMELPVGVITALLGGPFFLWLLAARR